MPDLPFILANEAARAQQIANHQANVRRFGYRASAAHVSNQLRLRHIELSQQIVVSEMVAAASGNAAGQAAEALSVFAATYVAVMNNKAGQFAKMFGQAGADAVEASAVKFAQNKKSRGGSSDYRSNAPGRYRRYSGGQLRRAIASPANYQATSQSLLFINTTHMDLKAAQWYRLNFGAGAAGARGRRPKPRSIRFFNTDAGSISLERYAPSAGFALPPGFWYDSPISGGQVLNPQSIKKAGGQGDVFVPFGSLTSQNTGGRDAGALKNALLKMRKVSVRKETKGIAAQGFFDVGLARLAKTVPRGTEAIFAVVTREALDDASSASAGLLKKFDISQAAIKVSEKQALKAIKNTTTQAEKRIAAEAGILLTSGGLPK